jgi:hypothetical protein
MFMQSLPTAFYRQTAAISTLISLEIPGREELLSSGPTVLIQHVGIGFAQIEAGTPDAIYRYYNRAHERVIVHEEPVMSVKHGIQERLPNLQDIVCRVNGPRISAGRQRIYQVKSECRVARFSWYVEEGDRKIAEQSPIDDATFERC